MANSSDYEVKAKLILDARKAASAAARYQAQIQKLAKSLENADRKGAAQLARGTRQAAREADRAARAYQRMGDKATRAAMQAAKARKGQVAAFGGMGGGGMGIGSILGAGAITAGLSVIVSTFTRATASAITYVGWLDKTKIGLTSVIAAVENAPWEDAEKKATQAFKAIQDLAIKSPATSAEMFEIYSGIFGPIRSAGFEMEKVLDITNDTVNAASALNVDYAQASRDISSMARGTAGIDVKLFSMLRSTGAIKEDAQAWNALLPAERVTKLATALKKFSAAGEKYGKSWIGITSSFTDIVQNMGAKAFTPITGVIGARLDRFNQYVLANRDAIGSYLERLGTRVADKLNWVFTRAQMGLRFVISHWDQIIARVKQVATELRAAAPMLAKGAAAYATVKTGAGLVGGGANMIAGISSLASTFGAGGGGAAAGGAAAGGAGLAALAPVLAGVAAAGALAAGVFMVVQEQWGNMVKIFGPSFAQVTSMALEFGGTLWHTLAPILKMVANVVMAVLAPAWTVVTALLRGFMFAFGTLADLYGSVTNAVYDKIKPAFDFLFDLFARFAKFVDEVFSEARKGLGTPTSYKQIDSITAPEWTPSPMQAAFDAQALASARKSAAKPAATMQVNNDFRGSRIQIKQDFKGDTDPDRVVSAMMNDLTRQAEARISSGFAGALTR